MVLAMVPIPCNYTIRPRQRVAKATGPAEMKRGIHHLLNAFASDSATQSGVHKATAAVCNQKQGDLFVEDDIIRQKSRSSAAK